MLFPKTVILGLLQFVLVNSWYLPGVQVKEFNENEKVPLYVTKLNSDMTQIPYSYYELPFCQPDKVERMSESLGEILTGEISQNTLYDIEMKKNAECKILCSKYLTVDEVAKFRKYIQEGYQAEMTIDNMPIVIELLGPATNNKNGQNKPEQFYQTKIPIGSNVNQKVAINNHMLFTLKYSPYTSTFTGKKSYRFVGAQVEPISQNIDKAHACQPSTTPNALPSPPLYLPETGEASVTFTYKVQWVESTIEWSLRLDAYLKSSPDEKIEMHWLPLLRFVIIVLFLSVIAAIILFRTVLKDISTYNGLSSLADEDEEIAIETGGWKLLHGDVFRKPDYFTFLCSATGTGVQLFLMTLFIGLFATIGIISPAIRGLLIKSILFGYIIMGLPAGYIATRLCRLADPEGVRVSRITAYTACSFPLFCFCIFTVINIVLSMKGSSGAVPFSTLLFLLLLWSLFAIPLVCFGSWLGSKAPPLKIPCRTNTIARQIPPKNKTNNPILMIVFGGLFVFAAFMTEYEALLTAVWQHEYYYQYIGFLFFSLLLTVIVCIEVSFCVCYLLLVSEDWRWWWFAFATSAFAGVWVFIFSCLYFFTQMTMVSITSIFIFFGYTLLLSYAITLMTGSIGLLGAVWLVYNMYSAIKID